MEDRNHFLPTRCVPFLKPFKSPLGRVSPTTSNSWWRVWYHWPSFYDMHIQVQYIYGFYIIQKLAGCPNILLQWHQQNMFPNAQLGMFLAEKWSPLIWLNYFILDHVGTRVQNSNQLLSLFDQPDIDSHFEEMFLMAMDLQLSTKPWTNVQYFIQCGERWYGPLSPKYQISPSFPEQKIPCFK